MKILICGIDGYIGYPLALHLMRRGHQIYGLDNYSRRALVAASGSNSLTPILERREREKYLSGDYGFPELVARIDLTDEYNTSRVLNHFEPDAIVHLAEQPSAPWSMKNVLTSVDTQRGNVLGTLSLLWAMKEQCPNAHLVKLGTMGEYGTPECDIPEGEIPESGVGASYMRGYCPCYEEGYECPMKGLPFPRSPGSFYHLSKVHDTYNIIFACKTWGLRSTDIMQGVVFGVGIEDDTSPEELTRFDYDQYFGTVINRFCTQAIIGHPLTIYGTGDQIRGYIPLKDSIQCLTIALENPPPAGEYRTFNQFESIKSINDLALYVFIAGDILGIPVRCEHLPNPRTEASRHYYNPSHQKLFDLGYTPTLDFQLEVFKLMKSILPYENRVIKEVIMPTTTWK